MQMFTVDRKRQILLCDDEESAISFACLRFLGFAQEAIQIHGRFSVALSGGSTPKKLYEQILESELAFQVDWSRVDVFWSDERAVPPDSPDSNYGMAMHYFSKEPLDIAKKYRMEADKKNLDKAAREYEDQIKKHCAEARLDLVLLGMGDDGHTASLFPNTDALSVKDRLVVANFVPQKETFRMTLTYPAINQARNIMVLAFGKAKAEALKEVLYGKPDFEKYPAQRIGELSTPTLFIIDKEAASELPIQLSTIPKTKKAPTKATKTPPGLREKDPKQN